MAIQIMNSKHIPLINMVTFFIIAIYTLFFINIVSNKGTDLSLIPIFFITAIPLIILNKKLFITKTLILTCITPVLFISLNELFLKPALQLSDDLNWLENVSLEYQNQFLWMSLLLFIPTSIILSKFSLNYFFNVLLITLFISIGLNGYINFTLNFDRGSLAQALSPVILYDYTNITLTFLVLCYGFYLKQKSSYFVIILALINLGLIALHGSRGAWLGIPPAFLILFIIYFKTDLKKIIFITALTLCALITSLLIPNSPVYDRLQAFNQDAELIESENYNSSVGTRVALWKFAISEFPKAPLTGVGITQLRQNICEYDQRVIRLDQCQLHVHNTYLQALAAHGLLGLISVFVIIFIPLSFFIRSLFNNTNPNIQLLAGAGVVAISYLSICFLTDTYFIFSRHTMFYYIIILTLLGLIMKENLKKA